ncbi:MAG: hypothetical protein R3E95_05840 [Thiolinea sp.]
MSQDEPKIDWDAKALDAFFNSPYTYEDAEHLARLWNQPGGAYAGKKLIGAKLLNGNQALLDKLLKGGPAPDEVKWEEKWLDAFFDSPYSYEDAELLAQLWSLPSTYEGKKLIGAKILNGLEYLLPEKIRHDKIHDEPPQPDAKAFDAFFSSPYTYEDAELLAQLWNLSVVDAKETIGIKVIHGIEDALPAKIRRT